MRYSFIDVARGINIILVVLGHCMYSADIPLNKMIMSFHMPLFFFLSGIFAKRQNDISLAFLRRISLKSRRLLISHVFLSLTIIVLNCVLCYFNGKGIWEFDIWECFCYWFLLVLFSCVMIFMVVSVFVDVDKNLNRIAILMVTACLVAFSLKYEFPVQSLSWFNIIPTAFLFYTIGYFSRNYVLSSFGDKHTASREMLVVLSIPLLYIACQLNVPIKMYENRYGFYPLFLATSFLGIFVVMEISKSIKFCSFFEEMGKLSIVVYVWNFLVIGLIMRLFTRLSQAMGIMYENIVMSMIFLASLSVLYGISKITYRYFPWLYGLKKNE